jgi:hypothetical protein
MSSIKWGPPTWSLIHTLIETAQKTNFINFNNFKIQLFNIIKNICIFSSCPTASHNSKIFFEKTDLNKLNNINDFKILLYIFHNFINSKRRVQLFNYNDMNIYENINIKLAYNNFINIFIDNNIQINIKMKQTIKELSNFIKFLMHNKSITKKENDETITEDLDKEKEEDLNRDKDKEKEDLDKDKVMVETITEDLNKDKVMVETITEDLDLDKDKVIVETITEDLDLDKDKVIVETITEDLHKDKEKDENIDKIEIDEIIKSPSTSTSNVQEGMSVLDDKLLPAFNLTFSEALLEIKKNPNCVPFQVYVDRWRYFNKKYNNKKNKQNKQNKQNNLTNTIIIDESLLPPFNLSLPIAIIKIQNNPLCVPTDLYIKKWNEIKLLAKYKKI